MKVIHLCPRTLRTHGAGIEYNVMLVSKFLQKKGVKQELFCTADKPQGRVEYNGLSLREFSSISPNDSYFFSWPLFRALDKEDADIIHCHGFNNLVSPLGILAKKKNQKLVLSLHSAGSSSLIRKFLHIPLTFFYRAHLSKIDKIVCLSEWEKRTFEKKFGAPASKFVVIPNGIEKEFFEIKRKPNPHIILSVGRLVKNKGMHRLIDALPLLRKKDPQIELHIVGDGSERERLTRLAHTRGVSSSVFFHGNISRENRASLRDWYAQAGVFALLSDEESQGIVYVEAMAARVPVVAPNKGLMHDYVDAGAAAGVEDPDNIHEVARVLETALQKKGPKKPALSPAAKAWVKKPEDTGKAVLELYKDLLQSV